MIGWMSKHHRRKGSSRNQRGKKSQLWVLLFNKEKYGKCCFCGKALLFDEATVEHLIPLSEGGSDKVSSGNLSISCLKCNNGRARDGHIVRLADMMAKRLYNMCIGKKETSVKWSSFVKAIKSSGKVSLEKCKEVYLNIKKLEDKSIVDSYNYTPEEWVKRVIELKHYVRPIESQYRIGSNEYIWTTNQTAIWSIGRGSNVIPDPLYQNLKQPHFESAGGKYYKSRQEAYLALDEALSKFVAYEIRAKFMEYCNPIEAPPT